MLGLRSNFGKGKSNLNGILTSSLGMTLVGLCAGVLGYVYQIIVGRMLAPAEYGVLISLTSLGTVFSSPLAAVSMLVTKNISSLLGTNNAFEVRGYYKKIIIRMAWIGIILGLCLVPFLQNIADFLKCESLLPIVLFIVITYFGAFGSINNSYFQGTKNFKWLGSISIFSVSIKLVLATILIYAGMGINGALIGIMLAALIPTVISFLKIYFMNQKILGKINISSQKTKSSIFPIFLATLAFALMTQMDVVLVNRFFSSHDAGFYSAAATLGRTVLYLPGGVAIVIFPYVASLHAQGSSDYRDFYKLFFLTFLMCIIAALFLYLFSDFIIHLFYGEAYTGAGNILKWYGFTILPMAMIMLAENFLIAKGELIFTWIFILIAPAQVIVLYYFHQDILSVLKVMFYSGFFLLFLGISIIYIKNHKLKTA